MQIQELCLKKKIDIPKFDEKTQPSQFFLQLEKGFLANEEPRERWAVLLPVYLTGTALEIYNAEIAPDMMDFLFISR